MVIKIPIKITVSASSGSLEAAHASIEEAFTEARDKLYQSLSKLKLPIELPDGTAIPSLEQITRDLDQKLGDAFEALTAQLKFPTMPNSELPSIKELIQKLVQSALQQIKALEELIAQKQSQLTKSIKDQILALAKQDQDRASELADAARSKLAQARDQIMAQFKDGLAQLEALKEQLIAKISSLKLAYSGLCQGGVPGAPSALPSFQSIVNALVDSALDLAMKLAQPITDQVLAIADQALALKDMLLAQAKALEDQARALRDKIQKMVKDWKRETLEAQREKLKEMALERAKQSQMSQALAQMKAAREELQKELAAARQEIEARISEAKSQAQKLADLAKSQGDLVDQLVAALPFAKIQEAGEALKKQVEALKIPWPPVLNGGVPSLPLEIQIQKTITVQILPGVDLQALAQASLG